MKSIKLNKIEELKKKEIINFEYEIKKLYEDGKIKSPIHLSGDNEDQLISIFRKINRDDWVISSWRNHYHALLHGISKTKLKKLIMSGKSMGIISKKK